MRLRAAPTLGAMFLRPVVPEDAGRIQQFVRALSPESRRERFFSPILELTAAQLERITSNPGLTLAAFDRNGAIVALAEYAAAAPGEAELALVVADDWQHQGLGDVMLARLMEHARSRGFVRMSGITSESNRAMRALAARAGFAFRRAPDPAFVRFERPLIHIDNKAFPERNSAITADA